MITISGIKGLIAYTSPQNKGMIRLFNKLPYSISSEKDDDMIILNCLFSEPADKEKAAKMLGISSRTLYRRFSKDEE